jgi:hypothetical protein
MSTNIENELRERLPKRQATHAENAANASLNATASKIAKAVLRDRLLQDQASNFFVCNYTERSS